MLARVWHGGVGAHQRRRGTRAPTGRWPAWPRAHARTARGPALGQAAPRRPRRRRCLGAVVERPYAMASLGARRLLRPRPPLRSTGCFSAYPEVRPQEHFLWRSTIGRRMVVHGRIGRIPWACNTALHLERAFMSKQEGKVNILIRFRIFYLSNGLSIIRQL